MFFSFLPSPQATTYQQLWQLQPRPSSRAVRVGDVVRFVWSGEHNVARCASENDFNNCNCTNVISSAGAAQYEHTFNTEGSPVYIGFPVVSSEMWKNESWSVAGQTFTSGDGFKPEYFISMNQCELDWTARRQQPFSLFTGLAYCVLPLSDVLLFKLLWRKNLFTRKVRHQFLALILRFRYPYQIKSSNSFVQIPLKLECQCKIYSYCMAHNGVRMPCSQITSPLPGIHSSNFTVNLRNPLSIGLRAQNTLQVIQGFPCGNTRHTCPLRGLSSNFLNRRKTILFHLQINWKLRFLHPWTVVWFHGA